MHSVIDIHIVCWFEVPNDITITITITKTYRGTETINGNRCAICDIRWWYKWKSTQANETKPNETKNESERKTAKTIFSICNMLIQSYIDRVKEK